ncbi:MAG: hypothetical protein HGA83_07565 [Bacteroidales bacterium]|nr:hypothetical protein [Bacteroidales bacterium]
MIKLFFAGGALYMGLLTLELIALLLSAWKAPAWVKEIGLIALMTGILSQLYGVFCVCDAVEIAGDIPAGVLAGGLKVSIITVIYGGLIYLLSLIIRIIQKPRI